MTLPKNVKLSRDAFVRFQEGQEAGLITETEAELIEIITDQEIITYQDSSHSFVFDGDDLIIETTLWVGNKKTEELLKRLEA